MGNWFSDLGNSLSTFFSDLFTNLGTFFGDLWTNLSSAFTSLGSNIGNFFNSLWANIGNAFQGIFTWFGDFFDGLKNLFIYIFVPEDGYFDGIFEDLKTKFNNKIPYNDYIETLDNLDDVEVDGIHESISINNYQISNNLSVSKDKWIDLSIFNQYKERWYVWTRVVIYILLIIYNVNEVIKLFRGASAVSGSVASLNNKATSNK